MLNDKEYDFDMKLTKVYKNCKDIAWISFIEYEEECIYRGAILEIKNFQENEKCTKFIFFDSIDEDCSLSLLYLTGKKAGSIWVRLPLEAYCENTRAISTIWFVENFNKWIAPNSNINDVLFLYNDCCPDRSNRNLSPLKNR